MDDPEQHGADTERSVVELLATWGAVAEPDLGDLLAVLSDLRETHEPTFLDDAQVLQRVLEDPEVALPASLQHAVQRTLASSGAGRDAATAEEREQLLTSVADHLTGRIRECQQLAARDLEAWTLNLDGAEREQVLHSFWSAQDPTTMPEQLTALETLRQLRAQLEARGRTLAQEVRTRLEGQGGDAGIRDRARRALEGDSPAELATAWRALSREMPGAEQADLDEKVAAGRRRLAELCEQARRLAAERGDGTSGNGLPPMALAVQGAESLLRPTSAGTSARNASLTLEAVTAWTQALGTLLDAWQVDRTSELAERQALVKAVRSRMKAALTAGHVADVPRLEAAGRNLHEATASGEDEFQRAFDAALAELHSQGPHRDEDLGEAVASVREAGRRLHAFLERAGRELPTALVVQARSSVIEVEPTVAAGDAAAMESLHEALTRSFQKLKQVHSAVLERGRNEEDAERKRLRREADRLLPVAKRGQVRAIEKLAAEARTCDAEERPDLERRIGRTVGSVERRLRRAASRTLQEAARRFPEKGGRSKETRQEVHELADRVREALGEEPAVLHESTVALRGAVRRLAPWSRPGRRIAVQVCLLAVLGGALFAWTFFRTYPVQLTLDPLPGKSVEILVVDVASAREERERFDPGIGELSLKLRPGRHEVYVDNRYTGRVLDLPGDRGRVSVPFPASPGVDWTKDATEIVEVTPAPEDAVVVEPDEPVAVITPPVVEVQGDVVLVSGWIIGPPDVELELSWEEGGHTLGLPGTIQYPRGATLTVRLSRGGKTLGRPESLESPDPATIQAAVSRLLPAADANRFEGRLDEALRQWLDEIL